MTDTIDLREFMGGFIAESDELIASANALLIEIEKANATGELRPRAVRDLFRALHTIKGLAGMVDVEPVVEIAHGLETLLKTADRGGGVLRSGAVEVVLRGVAAIAERIRAVAEDRTPAPPAADLLEAIAAADPGAEASPPPMAELDDPELDTPGAIGRSVVRVELKRLDELQEQLSLLIVSRFRLVREINAHAANGHDVRRLREVADLQDRQLRALRRAILRTRMVRVAEVLDPLALLVRSLARSAKREVRLEILARDVEVDKAVADRLLPALVHLVRNAVDHAIEAPDVRLAKGKPRVGVVRVTCAEIAGNRLEVVVQDDGRGIDRAVVGTRANRAIHDDVQLLDVLTRPGFSTRAAASHTSGRGLGMDIVRRIATGELGGELAVSTTIDAGTSFTLRVPLTIAVVEVFSFVCGPQTFVVPVSTVDEILELTTERVIAPVAARAEVSMIVRRGKPIAIVSLGTLLAIDDGANANKAIVICAEGEPVGFAVDRMLGRQEVVVRPVVDMLARAPGIAGSTDLGDGRPTLVLDLNALRPSGRERHVS